MAKKYTITAALPYANGALHLGHLSGAYLPADIYARFLRLQGKDVAFICGSDEHGAAITIRAKKEGVSPKDIIDKYHSLNKKTFEELGISFDIYHRTSDELHYDTAQDFFLKLHEKGAFEEKTTEQYYDEKFNQFLADRYILGTCPKCSYEEAYGDQCENCGSALSPIELINPRSTMSGETPILKSTTHWYLKLNESTDFLKTWIEEGKANDVQLHDPKSWKKHVIGQCLSWLEGGLQPRSVTRDLDWGVPVPLEGADGKVLYVWLDAPIGYISATKEWAKANDKDWESYWKGDDVELVHFIGKDNIVFHCIIFPAMLNAHGDYALPKNVPANQFLNFEGRKFSKSKMWGIEQHEYLEKFKDFPNKEDALRYALIKNMPELSDSDFKWDEFEKAHDNELVANLGNFVNRVVVLTHKYYGGSVPDFEKNLGILGVDGEETSSFFIISTEVLWPLVERLEKEILKFEFKNATKTLMEISTIGNTVLQHNAPWSLYKENPESEVIKAVMAVGLQITAALSVLLRPFLPFTSGKLREMLNLKEAEATDYEALCTALESGKGYLESAHQIGEAQLLFAKINDRKDNSRRLLIDQQKALLVELLAAEEAAVREPIKSTMTFDDFTKLDLRTGTITSAEKIKKADKLLKLTVDIGLEQRTVVSGIAKFFKPEEVIGQQVVLLANLAPRKLRGVESQGMILMAENEKGELAFVSPQEGFGNGLVVR